MSLWLWRCGACSWFREINGPRKGQCTNPDCSGRFDPPTRLAEGTPP